MVRDFMKILREQVLGLLDFTVLGMPKILVAAEAVQCEISINHYRLNHCHPLNCYRFNNSW